MMRIRVKQLLSWAVVIQFLSVGISLGTFSCSTTGDSITCSNDLAEPVSVLLLPHKNCNGRSIEPACFISSTCEFPFAIAPGQQLKVVRMTDGGSMCGWYYNFQVSYQAAIPDTMHRYSPPFQGLATIGQSYRGCNPSHCGDTGDAVDFILARFAPIVAAREGVVTLVVDGHGDGGSCRRPDGIFDPSAFPHIIPNVVRIRHSDNTEAEYVHLESGIKVKVGDAVRRGQLIGQNGNSGCSGDPHLHFQVLGRSGSIVPSQYQVPAGALSGSKWHPGFYAVHTVPVRFDFPCIKDFIPQLGMRLLGAAEAVANCPGPTTLCSPCAIPSAFRPTDSIGVHANIRGVDGSLSEICVENAWSHPVRCDFTLTGDVLDKLRPADAIIKPGSSIVFGILSAKKAYSFSVHNCTKVSGDASTCTKSTNVWKAAPSDFTPRPTPAPTLAPTPAPTPARTPTPPPSLRR